MAEYIVTFRLSWDTLVGIEADNKKQAVEQAEALLSDYQVWFDDELFPFHNAEVLSVEKK